MNWKGESVMEIDTENLVENLVSKALNIKDYEKIIQTFDKKDISLDKDFQKTFNRFYRVRRNDDWQKSYYTYFEKKKLRKNTSFEEILYHLYRTTGQIEHSFSSKMLATINPNMPIWDVYVLNHIGLELSGKSKVEQLRNRVHLYDKIINWYDMFLKTDKAKQTIKLFDSIMPNYKWLTPTKKIDYIIWGVRD